MMMTRLVAGLRPWQFRENHRATPLHSPISSPARPADVYLVDPRQITKALPPLAEACYEELRDGFARQECTAHTLASDPSSAEFVLAPIQGEGYGPCLEVLRASPLYRRHGRKVVAYSLDSNQLPAVRGLYPSISRQWVAKGWALPAHYISSHYHKFGFTPAETREKDILYSFVGSSRTHPVRERIMRSQHPRGAIVEACSPTDECHWWEKENKADYVVSFREITRRSQFVICPRGMSPSSLRLFEAMEAGAVPIIVSDKVELPLGPRWEEFSFRVREREVDALPQLIESWAGRAAEMGAVARAEWERSFSPQATVATVVEWSRRILAQAQRRSLRLAFEEYTTLRFVKGKVLSRFRRRKEDALV